MSYFYVEITDTFAGEANYSWVTRHKIMDFGDMQRWDSRSGATCAFVSYWDDTEHGEYRVNVME